MYAHCVSEISAKEVGFRIRIDKELLRSEFIELCYARDRRAIHAEEQ